MESRRKDTPAAWKTWKEPRSASHGLPGTPDEFHLRARLVRCERRQDEQRNHIHRLGLMFVDMPESTRSRIVRFVFGVQKSAVRG